ncbi:CHAD domain-containing protein [Lysobacter koreensis]|uniref:CHAD domain-containing protein n=1 Tax=Lysobacter koreensis TaxID=266122 RepID=A0ABW2YPK3_9GAMM
MLFAADYSRWACAGASSVARSTVHRRRSKRRYGEAAKPASLAPPFSPDAMATAVAETDVAAGAALRAYAEAELGRAIECLGWTGARVHTGVHQARKSMRRVRATLDLGGAALRPGSGVLERELRAVIRQLSAARDAQALVETLDRLIGASAKEDERKLLRRARRAAARGRVAAIGSALARDPGFGEKRALLQFLRTLMADLPWARVAMAQARRAIASSAQAVEKAAARARSTGRDNDWHRWRRRARRLSQQQRALTVIGEPAPRQRTDKQLAVLLGEAQDYSLLRDHCGDDALFGKRDSSALCRLAEAGARRVRRKIEKAAAKGA